MSKQRIFTSYFGNERHIPKEVKRISICLSPPKGWVGAECKDLAPTWDILNAWRSSKKDSSAEEAYTKAFKGEILREENFMLIMWKLAKLAQGRDVVLLCYEKPSDFCHRHIVAQWIREHSIPCEEWSK